jgi:predicted deacetylase
VVEKRPAMPNKGHYRLHKSKSMVRSVFLRQSYTLRIYTKLVPIGETAKGAKAKGRLGLYKVDFKVEEARKVLPGTWTMF